MCTFYFQHSLPYFPMINIKSAKEAFLLWPTSISCFREQCAEKDSEVTGDVNGHKERNGGVYSSSLHPWVPMTSSRCHAQHCHPLWPLCIPHSSRCTTSQNTSRPSSLWRAKNFGLEYIKNERTPLALVLFMLYVL